MLPQSSAYWRAAELPQFSADGRELYFLSRNTGGETSIWKSPVEGGRPELVVDFDDPARPVLRPYWVLGREHIYFLVQEQQTEVWEVVVERD